MLSLALAFGCTLQAAELDWKPWTPDIFARAKQETSSSCSTWRPSGATGVM